MDYCQFTVGVWTNITVLLLPQDNETADLNIFIWDYTTGQLLVNGNSYNPGQYESYSFSSTPGHIYRIGITGNKATDRPYQVYAY